MNTAVGWRWSGAAVVLCTVGVAAYGLALAWGMENTSFHVWDALLVAPVLVALTVPVAIRAARTDPWFGRMLIIFLLLKLAGALVRFVVGETVYGGSADSNSYAQWGIDLAAAYREGDFVQDIGRELIGTGVVRIITGIVFVMAGPSKIAGFLVYSWLAFWGLFFFYQALRAGFPEADHRRYALLLFLLPSHLYWPSSIGKEAWMVFSLGLATWGAAKLTVRQHGGYVLLALGLTGITLVRPHLGVLVGGGLVAAMLLRPRAASPLFGALGKAIMLLLMLGVSFFMLERTEAFFGNTDAGAGVGGNGGQITSILEHTAERTTQGGSEFQAVTARSPAQLPKATVAVLFRPFPWEAGNVQSLVASIEGVFLVALYLLSAARLKTFLRWARARPYLVFTVAYTVLFVVAFSNVGNFGILARQRVQLFPVLLVLLALPKKVPLERRLRPAPRSAGGVR